MISWENIDDGEKRNIFISMCCIIIVLIVSIIIMGYSLKTADTKKTKSAKRIVPKQHTYKRTGKHNVKYTNVDTDINIDDSYVDPIEQDEDDVIIEDDENSEEHRISKKKSQRYTQQDIGMRDLKM